MDVRLGNGAHVELGTAQTLLGVGGFEGYDYANLGSRNVAGNDVVALSVGVRVPINEHLILGAAYEIPLTDQRGHPEPARLGERHPGVLGAGSEASREG